MAIQKLRFVHNYHSCACTQSPSLKTQVYTLSATAEIKGYKFGL